MKPTKAADTGRPKPISTPPAKAVAKSAGPKPKNPLGMKGGKGKC